MSTELTRLPTRTAYLEKAREYNHRWRKRHPELNADRNREYKRRYRERHPNHDREQAAKNANGLRDQFIEHVEATVVYAMHGGRCGICRQFVAADEAEIDHVVALSQGGSHGYINVQPAHPSCNRRKHNKDAPKEAPQ